MNGRQRRKLLAGAGLISMLIGALMVVAPTGAGAEDLDLDPAMLTSTHPNLYGVYGSGGNNANLKCSTGQKPANVADGLPQGFDDRPGDDWDNQPLNFAGLASVPGTYTTSGSNPLQIAWSSTTPVRLVIVKQATVSAVFLYETAASFGTVPVILPQPMTQVNGVSHVEFCAGGENPPAETARSP